MKVVDEHESIKAIEKKIAYGIIEQLIMQAHNELKLIRIMKGKKNLIYSSRMGTMGFVRSVSR
jgi:hypothetical protein